MESAYFSRHVCGNDHLFISRSRCRPPRHERWLRRPGMIGHFTSCGLWSVGGERERGRPSGQISNPGNGRPTDRRPNPSPPATTVATVGRKPSSRPPFSARPAPPTPPARRPACPSPIPNAAGKKDRPRPELRDGLSSGRAMTIAVALAVRPSVRRASYLPRPDWTTVTKFTAERNSG